MPPGPGSPTSLDGDGPQAFGATTLRDECKLVAAAGIAVVLQRELGSALRRERLQAALAKHAIKPLSGCAACRRNKELRNRRKETDLM